MTITVKDATGNNQTINTINPNGLTTAANSQPVVIASDQAAVPVSVASLPLPAGSATAALQTTANSSLATIATNTGTSATAALQTTGNTSLATIASKLPSAVGQKTGAASLSVVPSSDTNFPVSASGYSLTSTAITVTTTSAQLIAANSARKYLSWMVIGTSDVTVSPGATAAVAGAGIVYQSSGAGKQGASQEFPNGAPTNAFQVIGAAAGSIMYVWEGV